MHPEQLPTALKPLPNRHFRLSLMAALTFSLSPAYAVDTAATTAQRNADQKIDIEEIFVSGEKQTPNTEPSELTKRLLDVPGTFGDAFGAVFTLPGVVEETEGDGQPAVRGTGPEDNEFLIDFLPASYVFHDLGLSIFNEHLIQDFGLHAAGAGPEYGQATGAIFDVSLREPRQQPFSATVDLSFLRAGFLLEGELTENHALYVSGRQSLIHLLLKAVDDDLEEEEDITIDRYPKWQDYQVKYSWTPNDNNRVSILALGSNDRAALSFGARSDEALLDPGSTGRASLDTKFESQGLRWDYTDERNALRVGVGRLLENTEQQVGDGRDHIELTTESLTGKADYERTLAGGHSIRVGGQIRKQDFDYDLDLRHQSCSRFDPDCEQALGDVLTLDDSLQVKTVAGFADVNWLLSEQLQVSPGIRYTHNNYLDKSFFEPRLNVRYQWSDAVELSARYGQYHQLPFIDELAPEIGNPELSAPEATHYVVGAKWQPNTAWSASADFYYKKLSKLALNVDDSRNYVNGVKGQAYGVELMLERKLTDRFSGWASLSWAKSKRTNKLTDTSFAADHDTPIVANVVANYRLKKWNFSARWNLRSGSPFTPITGNRENPDFAGAFLPVYGELNSKRADMFHRLDLRAERSFSIGRVKGSFYLDVINAYGASNSGEVFYEPIENSAGFELKKKKGLPALPSIGISLTF